MKDFFEIVLAQRACRDFSDQPMPDKDVEYPVPEPGKKKTREY